MNSVNIANLECVILHNKDHIYINILFGIKNIHNILLMVLNKIIFK